MEPWRKNLQDYMTKKGKPLDLIIYTTHINIKLIAILQQIKDEIECFENFTVELRRKRFKENISFPLPASTFVIKYENEDLLEYQFMWVQNPDGIWLDLMVLITNSCHQRFDDQLKVDMGTLPDWLVNCKYCEPVEKMLCSADEICEDIIAGFIIEYFQAMTKPYLF